MSSLPSDPLADVPRGPLRRTFAALCRVRGRRLRRELDDCRAERDRWRWHADSYERELTHALLERAHLLAWLAALHPSSAVLTSGSDGTHLLCVEAGGRRLSWRLAQNDLPLFTHVPYARPVTTDGHAGTPDQAAHIRSHTRLLAMEGSLFGAPAETGAPRRYGDD